MNHTRGNYPHQPPLPPPAKSKSSLRTSNGLLRQKSSLHSLGTISRYGLLETILLQPRAAVSLLERHKGHREQYEVYGDSLIPAPVRIRIRLADVIRLTASSIVLYVSRRSRDSNLGGRVSRGRRRHGVKVVVGARVGASCYGREAHTYSRESATRRK